MPGQRGALGDQGFAATHRRRAAHRFAANRSGEDDFIYGSEAWEFPDGDSDVDWRKRPRFRSYQPGWGERARRSHQFNLLSGDHGGFDGGVDHGDFDGGVDHGDFDVGLGGRQPVRWSGGASGFHRRGGSDSQRRPAFCFGGAGDAFRWRGDCFHREGRTQSWQRPALGASRRNFDGGRHGGTGWGEHGLGCPWPRRRRSSDARWRGNGFAGRGTWRAVVPRGCDMAVHGSGATEMVTVLADEQKGCSDLDPGSRDSIFCSVQIIESKIFRFECFAPSLIRITELKNDIFSTITFDLDGAYWLKDSMYDTRLKNWKITRFEDSRTIHLSFDFNSAGEFFHLWVAGGQGIYIPAGSQNRGTSLFISGLAEAIAYLKKIEKGVVQPNAFAFEGGPSGVVDSLTLKDELIMAVPDFSFDDLGFSISKELFQTDIAINSNKTWVEGIREVHKTDNLDLHATISDLKVSIQETVSKGGEFLSANLLRDFKNLLSECAGVKNKPWMESNFTNFAHGGFGESEGTADSDDHPHSDTECGYDLDFGLQGLRDFQGHVSGDDNLTPFSSLSDLRDKDANRALCSKASQVTNDTAPFTSNRNAFMGANKKKGYHVKTRSQSRF